MKLKLTMRNVSEAKPGPKPYEMRDADTKGLMLRVQPSGVKAFIVEWSRGKRSTLGRFPALTLEGARKRARKAMAEVDTLGAPAAVIEAAKPVAGKVETFGDFMGLYKPHLEATAKAGKATANCIKSVFGYLYGDKLTSIERVTFDQFKAKRLKAGLHPSTVNRDLDRIKAALSKAVEWKLLAVNPLLGVRRIKRGIEDRVRYLSAKEDKALRKALEAREARFKARRLSGIEWRKERGREPLAPFTGYVDHLMPMTLLALNTGMRRGEITSLTWADVDLKMKQVTVRAGYAKSGKARHIPLNSEAVAVLKTWKKQEPEGRLFKLACTAKAWGRLMEKAKVDNFRFHDCRHDFASKLVMAGVDLNTVRELLGHSDIKMTLRYAHLAPEHKAAAVEVLVA